MRNRRVALIRRGLAGLVFQLCTAGGLTLGLMQGLDAGPPKLAHCAAGASCVGDELRAGVTPLLVPSFVGLFIGATVGILLALAIKRAR